VGTTSPRVILSILLTRGGSKRGNSAHLSRFAFRGATKGRLRVSCAISPHFYRNDAANADDDVTFIRVLNPVTRCPFQGFYVLAVLGPLIWTAGAPEQGFFQEAPESDAQVTLSSGAPHQIGIARIRTCGVRAFGPCRCSVPRYFSMCDFLSGQRVFDISSFPCIVCENRSGRTFVVWALL
jgi:hypothetical protein